MESRSGKEFILHSPPPPPFANGKELFAALLMKENAIACEVEERAVEANASSLEDLSIKNTGHMSVCS